MTFFLEGLDRSGSLEELLAVRRKKGRKDLLQDGGATACLFSSPEDLSSLDSQG